MATNNETFKGLTVARLLAAAVAGEFETLEDAVEAAFEADIYPQETDSEIFSALRYAVEVASGEREPQGEAQTLAAGDWNTITLHPLRERSGLLVTLGSYFLHDPEAIHDLVDARDTRREWLDLLEPLTANGWEWVTPFEIGDLTDYEYLSPDVVRDDSGTLLALTSTYHHERMIFDDPIEALLAGNAVVLIRHERMSERQVERVYEARSIVEEQRHKFWAMERADVSRAVYNMFGQGGLLPVTEETVRGAYEMALYILDRDK